MHLGRERPNSPEPVRWDEGIRRRVGLRLRGTLRALERQHPYARPAFVNRQERASLDVLTMRKVAGSLRGSNSYSAGVREKIDKRSRHYARQPKETSNTPVRLLLHRPCSARR
jgi:hypothetical protein